MPLSQKSSSGQARRESVNSSLTKFLDEKLPKSKDTPKAEKSDRPDKNEHDPKVKNAEKSELDIKFDTFRSEIRDMFQEFKDAFDSKLSAIDKKISLSFGELKTDISSIKTEITETKEELKTLKTKVNEIEESVDFHSKHVEEETAMLEDRIVRQKEVFELELEELKRKMMLQEKHDRKYNLLFYGFEEYAGEDLKETMKTFFKDKLKIDEAKVKQMQFANYHRLQSDAKGPNPIIVKFQSMQDRDLVMDQSFKPIMREEKKRILSDLPVPMKQERGRLAKLAYDIRQKEKLQTRIIEKGLSVHLEVRKDKNDDWERRSV